MAVVGVGIPGGSTVISVDSGTEITISNAATSTGTSVISFSISGRSGDLTSASDVIAITDTSGLVAGLAIAGNGIPVGSTIVSVVPSVSIQISSNATLTGTEPLTFSTSAQGTTTGPTVTFTDTSALGVGMHMEGQGIPSSTVISSVDSLTQITISNAPTALGLQSISFLEQLSGFGDGSSTFNIPDYQGRSMVGSGQGSGLSSRILGFAGGEEQTNSLPASTSNSITGTPSPDSYLGNLTSTKGITRTFVNVQPDTTIAGDSSEGNMQPYVTTNFMIKARY